MNKSNVISYQIKDMIDEIIKRLFYERELSKTKILQMNISLKKY